MSPAQAQALRVEMEVRRRGLPMKLGLKKTHARDGSPAQTHQVSQSRSLLIFSARPGQARDGETWKTAAHVLRKKGLSRDPVPSSPFAGLGAPITVGQPGVQVGGPQCP